MSSGLTYPSLKCVLEYLEANRRIHITARSPLFKQIGNEIPLHFDLLHLDHSSITVNNYRYVFHETPNGHLKYELHNSAALFHSGRIFNVNDPGKIMKDLFLKGGNEIHVNHLKVSSWEDRLIKVIYPIKLKIKIFDAQDDFHRWLLMIHPSSYPLQEVRINMFRPEWIPHKVVETAKQLTIVSADRFWYKDDLLEFPHSNVLFCKVLFSNEDILRLVKHWKQNGRRIGKSWRISGTETVVDGYLEVIKGNFYLRPVPENQCYSIPIDSTCELLISVIPSSSDLDSRRELKLEIAKPVPKTNAEYRISVLPSSFNWVSTREPKMGIAEPVPKEIVSLTYPSLKCVFEYLEANRRIHITARCPRFKRIANDIPIHFDHLHLYHFDITVNNYKYVVREASKTPNGLPKLEFYKSGRLIRLRHIPHKNDPEKIVKDLFLKGRNEIFVNHLDVTSWQYRPISLTRPIKLKIKKLETEDDFRSHLSMILPSSYPLQELRIGLQRPWFQHEVLKSAKQLTIVCTGRFWHIGDILGIPHSNVLSCNIWFRNEEILELVNHWKQNEREVGKSLRISGQKTFVYDYLEMIKIKFDVRPVSDNQCYSIPINSTCELLISVIPSSCNSVSRKELKMEIAKTAPEVISSKTNVEKFENDYFCLICIAMFLTLVLFLSFVFYDLKTNYYASSERV